MPYQVKKIGKKHRIVDAGTSRVARNKAGTAVDGGGHPTKAAATKQMQAMNINYAKGPRFE